MSHLQLIASHPLSHMPSLPGASRVVQSAADGRPQRGRFIARIEAAFFLALLCGTVFLGGGLLSIVRLGGGSAPAIARAKPAAELPAQQACSAPGTSVPHTS